MWYHCVLFYPCFVFFCRIWWCTRGKENEEGAHPNFDVILSPYPWVDAIAMTRWLLLPSRRTSCLSRFQTRQAAYLCHLGQQEQLKRWIGQQGPRSGACWCGTSCCCCCFDACGLSPHQNNERRGYMHHLFILSYPPSVALD